MRHAGRADTPFAFEAHEIEELSMLLPDGAFVAIPALRDLLELEAQVLREAADRPSAKAIRSDLRACAEDVAQLRSRLNAQLADWHAPHLADASRQVLGDACAVDVLVARISRDLAVVNLIQHTAANRMTIAKGRTPLPRSYLFALQRFLEGHGVKPGKNAETAFVRIVSICATALTRATGVALNADWIARDFDEDERVKRRFENSLVFTST